MYRDIKENGAQQLKQNQAGHLRDIIYRAS